MVKLLEWLLCGCAHTWVEDQRRDLISSQSGRRIGVNVYCHCAKCGLPKRFDLT